MMPRNYGSSRVGRAYACVLLVGTVLSAGAVAGDVVAPASAYTDALVHEALLEDATCSLRAATLYAEIAGVSVSEGQRAVRQAERALTYLQGELQADDAKPDLASMDFAEMEQRAARANTALLSATQKLRRAMAEQTGKWSTRPAFGPLPPLPTKPGTATSRLVFAALGPTATWAGWSEGPAAWDVLRALDLQAVSPWFGWYGRAQDGSDRPQEPALIQEMARRMEALGMPMVVWLEPEYNVGHLWEEIGEEMYLHDSTGLWRSGTRIHNTINVFHPRVREEMCTWLEQVARGLRGDRRIVGYELVEESSLRFDVSDPSGANHEPRYGGYSRAALNGFRARLQGKYADIGELNRKWGTRYDSFEQISPPPTLTRREGAWDGPEVALLVEFQEFRAAEHAECFRQMVAALHRGDPGCPVIPQFTTPLCGDPLGGVDLFRMGEVGWDIITFHTDTAFPYVYSIARYNKKPTWNDEFIWSGRVPREQAGEYRLRAHAAIELWRNLMWGSRGFVLFNLDFPWNHPKDGGDWNNDLLNDALGDRAPRYAAAVFPQVLRKVPTLFDELYESEVVDEGLMIVEPTASLYAAVPTGTVQWWARRIAAELTASSYRPAFCPERYVADGVEELSRYRTVVVPVGTYMPETVVERLFEWVSSGGTLIALGPFATHDPYGQSRAPDAPLAGLRPGDAARIGAGRVTVVPLGRSPDDVAEEVRQLVDEATGPRAAWATDSRLELMLRAFRRRGYVLAALNASPDERVTGQVHVQGRFRRITDVTVEGGMPVPAACPGGTTGVPVSLDPGEARVFLLR